jgi:hypothetical protein
MERQDNSVLATARNGTNYKQKGTPMSFWVEFSNCMHGSGLPTPAETLETAGEVIEFLDQLHNVAEVSGGVEITLGALEAAGFTAFGGSLADPAFDAAAITVAFYVGACAGCLVGASASTIADWLAQVEPSPDVRAAIVAAANDSGISLDELPA